MFAFCRPKQQPPAVCRSCASPARVRSHGLRGGADEDLVERHALRSADGEGDDVGDVLRGDAHLGRRCLVGSLAGGVGNVVGELGRDGAGLDDGDADVGLELDAQGF